LVHRDIKPANIHLGRVGLRHDFVKVLDFGLVKEVSNVSIGDSMSTIPGQMALGTPGYMAPEMALGEQVDGRADIYALGCVAYYLVTGELVFEAETAFQMIAKHLQSSPIPPSQRANKAVSPELERLILKCLSKNPVDRPQSAMLLMQALEFIPSDGWNEERARDWWSDSGRQPILADVAVLPAGEKSFATGSILPGT
jgi:serine/threonine-protein kinase